MKVVLIGATGFVGSSILKELISRKHQVLAISRNIEDRHEAGVTYKNLDVLGVNKLTEAIKGNDALISAFNAGWTNPNIHDDFLKGYECIQKAVKNSGLKRFIVVGGAGSLFVGNAQAVDAPDFPKEYYGGASAARDYLNILKSEQNLDWSFFSPAFEMHAGITTGRTGKFRLGLENPVFDKDNRSILSVEDLAVAVVDELEQNKHIKQRWTAAY